MVEQRRPLVAGNWKMHTTLPEARQLVQAVIAELTGIDSSTPTTRTTGSLRPDVVFCPPFVSLAAVREIVGSGTWGVGAQNAHWLPQGALTSPVCAPMLVGLADYVIIGHSERRQYYGEDDETVNRKLLAVIDSGLLPILCVGETLDENEAGDTAEVVSRQLRAGLDGVESPSGLVVAYEPIWAIGTGRAATGAQANDTIGLIRRVLTELHGVEGSSTRILYGGSVNAANVAELASQPEIDGALVGGASLKPAEFAAIVRAFGRA